MEAEAIVESRDELDRFIAAFEAARAQDEQADLACFLPDAGHPLYLEVLLELVRVDLEYSWTRGQGKRLEDYRDRFPALFEDSDRLHAITFEEFRLRKQQGEYPAPAEYRRRFGIDPAAWPVPAPHRPSREVRCWNSRVATQVLPDPVKLEIDAHVDDRARAVPGAVPVELAKELDHCDPQTAQAFVRALSALPEVGADFLGFHLIAELGRGAFGRVFLARQGDLADRPVALKIATDLLGESRSLAQLQHTNIVPIYSVHHAGPFHAVCMPYLGSVTLADILRGLCGHGTLPQSGKALVNTFRACRSATRSRDSSSPSAQPDSVGLPAAAEVAAAKQPSDRESVVGFKALEGMTYIQGVLWIGARLADGLAHAHERGILHQDLKPANVLLTDDGQPLLLDFNLARDTKLRASAPFARIGGTLPYMAPEHLTAFLDRTHGVDSRCDLYSLGVILHELLTGRHPFPVDHRGSIQDALPRMIRDRAQLPGLRCWNPAVSPAVESIVQHCLEAAPSRRYQSGRELQEDLERHLHNLPLRYARERSLRERAGKWIHRHPRFTSATSTVIFAAILLIILAGLFVFQRQRLTRMEAAETYQEFRQETRAAQLQFLDTSAKGNAQLAAIEESCRRALRRYEVLDDPRWQEQSRVKHLPAESQERLRAEVGELLYLLAVVIPMQIDPGAAPAHRQESVRVAAELNARAEASYPADRTPRALWLQRAYLSDQQGQGAEAPQLVERSQTAPLVSPRDCCMMACLYTTQGHFRKALPLWQRASAHEPQNVWAWYGLGHCFDQLERHAQATACYSACIALHPDFPGWYFRRGVAQLKQREYALACVDFDEAIRLEPAHLEGRINRALARLGLNEHQEALDDLTQVIDRGAPSTRVYLMRAQVCEKANDPQGAKRDRAASLRVQPTDEADWIARGVSRIARDPQAALTDFEQALALNPRSLPALENQAHVLAERLGRTSEALPALRRAVEFHPEYGPTRAALGTLLARLGQREGALEQARAALALAPSPALQYQVAGIYAQTSRQTAGDRRQALHLLGSALRQGFGHDLLTSDSDLDPVRDDPQFQQLLQAVRTLQRDPLVAPPGTPEQGEGATP